MLQCCGSFCCRTRLISYKCTHVLALLSLPALLPVLPCCAVTERPAQPLCSAAVCCWRSVLHMAAYICQCCFSPFIPPAPSPAVSTSPFSTSASLVLPCKSIHQYHFSRFRIYALIYVFVFLFLTYFTLCNWLWFIHLWHCLKLDAAFQPRNTNTVEILSLSLSIEPHLWLSFSIGILLFPSQETWKCQLTKHCFVLRSAWSQ